MRWSWLLLLAACSDSDKAKTDVIVPDTAVVETVVPETVAPTETVAPIDVVEETDAQACLTTVFEARTPSAALLTVMDASASMNAENKYSIAAAAIIGAVRDAAFDDVSLGLMAFPTDFAPAPQCLCDAIGMAGASCQEAVAPGVSCGVSITPQVPLALAGDHNTPHAGVRGAIADWLESHGPLSNSDDGSPVYDALAAGYDALRATDVARRVLVLVTDGGFSCTSLASPSRPAIIDGNGCPDWESPASVNALIANALADPEKPIVTFIVGVPGSASHGEQVGSFDTPPYSMPLALSTYAASGTHALLDPTCSSDAVFAEDGVDPAKPCHIDLSAGLFHSSALVEAIFSVRRHTLGCVFDPPASEDPIDPGLVNVILYVDERRTVPKRTDPNDTCTTSGCWDYTTDQRIELIGEACTSLTESLTADLTIEVGCETVTAESQ